MKHRSSRSGWAAAHEVGYLRRADLTLERERVPHHVLSGSVRTNNNDSAGVLILGCAGLVWVYLRNTLACLPNKLELVGISIKMSGRNPDHTIHYNYFVFVGTLRTGRKENSPKNE